MKQDSARKEQAESSEQSPAGCGGLPPSGRNVWKLHLELEIWNKKGAKHSFQGAGRKRITPRHGCAFPWVLSPHLPGLDLLSLGVPLHAIFITLNVGLENKRVPELAWGPTSERFLVTEKTNNEHCVCVSFCHFLGHSRGMWRFPG